MRKTRVSAARISSAAFDKVRAYAARADPNVTGADTAARRYLACFPHRDAPQVTGSRRRDPAHAYLPAAWCNRRGASRTRSAEAQRSSSRRRRPDEAVLHEGLRLLAGPANHLEGSPIQLVAGLRHAGNSLAHRLQPDRRGLPRDPG